MPVNTREVWLRGPLPVIMPALQPVGHALLQAAEEVAVLMNEFPEDLLWQKPAGLASVGFHLQHMTGVLERLFTYAAGKKLDEGQLAQLAAEGIANGEQATQLLAHFTAQVDKSLAKLQNISADTLFETRAVGRSQIPSTVMGLLVHAAEHSMRHLGQLLVTVKIVKAGMG